MLLSMSNHYQTRAPRRQNGTGWTLTFNEQMARGFKDIHVSRASSCDAEHGRIETRETFATDDIGWLKERHDWKGLNSIVMVVSSRETAKGVEKERRFYISSLPADADKLAAAIRAHWEVENSLHWVLDVNFRDDDCRIRKKNAPPTSLPSSARQSTR